MVASKTTGPDRYSYLSWRDISTGPMRVLEVTWLDADHKQRLTVLDFEFGCAPVALVGPDLDDVATLILAGDVRRFDRGLGTLHMDSDGPSDELRAALASMHKAVA